MSAHRPAPEFPDDLEWVNSSDPPRIADLRGRVVLLWFWSYDAVNCWNLIPDLRHFEVKYHDGLSVMGIHCPKYPRQRDNGALLRAVNRHRLRHAIANDADFRLWRSYGIEAWPTVALIDVEGRLAALFAGEGRRNEIDARIAQLLDEAALQDLRVYEPAAPVLRPEPRHALAFPGKLLADESRLYVSDSGHHRVLECTHDGRVLRCFGSGHADYVDGDLAHACFDSPQGLARWRNALYVADSGNHCVRRIDLGSGDITTVLGTGRAARSRPDQADPQTTALNTPLDLCVLGDDLYIAVAGQHQIWRLDLATSRVCVQAGSGELGLLDGAATKASLAQPSGLAVLGRQLVVADAAASAVRWINLNDGRVETAVGSGLYDFGDATGMRDEARLQNPLAVAADPRGTIYVADSYNNSIKLLNRQSGEVRALRMQHHLNEPQGLALTNNFLWIANTNLHEIVCIDLTGGAVRRVPVDEA
jgi:hypothetical protein